MFYNKSIYLDIEIFYNRYAFNNNELSLHA